MIRTRLAVVAILVSALSCIVAPPASAVPSAPEYVALGDSRAAAPTRTSARVPDGCGRTTDGYPTHVAARLGVTYKSVACVNAYTYSVTSNRQLTLFGFRPVQTDALSRSTRLVTLSIGGNDLQWWSLISACFTRTFGQDARCRHDRVMARRIDSGLSAVAPKIGTTLDRIASRAPNARVVLVGHGGYYGRTGCPGQANISNADAVYLQTFFQRFDAILRTAAVTRSMTFVDVASAAVGHDACAGPARWFEGNASQSQTQPRHPTPLGSRAIAALITRALSPSGLS
ncbi:SGNH/GDSL hydrolase family protein [Gordonia sp. 4N]|uniref:SGNH/GDSL hydrolase family protein n=1 Tax=Gordonia sp. 4N TaxID=2993508 RepID=UPI002248DC59|nr:SGNH/GDSL hydrolase family protein [Gordonia sp. 4N]MCX2755499.1 SGNH/GDSL hydrolase family protein [Gordonia sp. 4N]